MCFRFQKGVLDTLCETHLALAANFIAVLGDSLVYLFFVVVIICVLCCFPAPFRAFLHIYVYKDPGQMLTGLNDL